MATRVAALESGEVDFVDDLQADAYEKIKANPKLRPVIVRPSSWPTGVFNKKEGLMTNQKLRQAIQAAIDIEPAMQAGAGNPLFYRLDSALSFQEQKAWHTKVGAEPYNTRNKELAKKLLQEAGYKGEPVRWITTREYAWMYNIALVAKQQLEEVGVNVDLQVLDWATLVQRRNNPQMYDIFSTGMTLVPDPTQHPYLRCDWPGWTCDPDINGRMDAIRSRDRSEEADGAVGGGPQALLRAGAGAPLRRPPRAPGDAGAPEGLQRADGVPALLQRVAGEVRRRSR